MLCTDTSKYKQNKFYYFYVSLFNQIYWVTGSLAGSIIGPYLTSDTSGIVFSVTSLFTVIFTEQWILKTSRCSQIIGVGVTLVCMLAFGANDFLIPSMIIFVTVLSFLCISENRKRAKNNEQSGK